MNIIISGQSEYNLTRDKNRVFSLQFQGTRLTSERSAMSLLAFRVFKLGVHGGKESLAWWETLGTQGNSIQLFSHSIMRVSETQYLMEPQYLFSTFWYNLVPRCCTYPLASFTFPYHLPRVDRWGVSHFSEICFPQHSCYVETIVHRWKTFSVVIFDSLSSRKIGVLEPFLGTWGHMIESCRYMA